MIKLSKLKILRRKILTYVFRHLISPNHVAIYDEALDHLPHELNFMLFYGNLLFHTREDSKPFIDDIDLLLLDQSLTLDIIPIMKKKGFKFYGIVKTDRKILAIKFKYNECPVDIHSYDKDNDWFIHEAVHFRDQIAEKNFDSNIKYYKQSYKIRFQIKSLYNIRSNLYCPSNSNDILERFYSSDWKIPKSKNFIDYDSYEFVDNKVIVDMTGSH